MSAVMCAIRGVTVCIHAEKPGSSFFLHKSTSTATPHIPQTRTDYPPYPPSAPPRLPGILLHPPSEKKPCVQKLQCVRRHCGKPFASSQVLHSPFSSLSLSLSVLLSFHHCFEWVQVGLILMFIKLSHSCPC